MAREKGTFDFSANFEIKKEGTIDARQLVDDFNDLLLFSSDDFIPKGFIVSVKNDATIGSTVYEGGVYRCIDPANLSDPSSWEIVGANDPIDQLTKTEVEDEASTKFGLISGQRWYQAFTKHITNWWNGVTLNISDITNLGTTLQGKENTSNRRNNLNSPNNTTYPTTKAVKDVFDALPFTENYRASSEDPLTIVDNGTLLFQINPEMAFAALQDVIIGHDMQNYMMGRIIDYDYGSGFIDIEILGSEGSGTFTQWQVFLAGLSPLIEKLENLTENYTYLGDANNKASQVETHFYILDNVGSTFLTEAYLVANYPNAEVFQAVESTWQLAIKTAAGWTINKKNENELISIDVDLSDTDIFTADGRILDISHLAGVDVINFNTTFTPPTVLAVSSATPAVVTVDDTQLLQNNEEIKSIDHTAKTFELYTNGGTTPVDGSTAQVLVGTTLELPPGTDLIIRIDEILGIPNNFHLQVTADSGNEVRFHRFAVATATVNQIVGESNGSSINIIGSDNGKSILRIRRSGTLNVVGKELIVA